MAHPVIGNFGNSGTSWHNTNTGSATVTPANTSGVLLAIVTSEDTAATVQSVSSTSLNSSKWSRIASLHYGASGSPHRDVIIEVWMAAFSTPLGAQVVTPIMTGNIDCAALEALEIGGSGIAVDTNGSIPATASHQDFSGFTATTPQVAGVTTNATDPLVLAIYGSGTAGLPSAGAGYNMIDTINSNAGTHQALQAVEDKIPGAALSGTTVGFTGTSIDWGMIVLAFSGSGPPVRRRPTQVNVNRR